MKTQISIIALMVAISSQAFAEVVVELDEISLSANLDEVETDKTGAQVKIINAESVKTATTANVADLLGQQAGVSVSTSGPIGGNSSVVVRGARQQEVKVEIDGIDVSDPSLPQSAFDFGGFTLGTVGQIEVVKGSQSAVHGSGAVGGVISIHSPVAPEQGFAFSSAIEYGSYNTVNLASMVAHGGFNHSVVLTFAALKSDGFSALDESDGYTEDDGFEGQQIGLNLRYDLNNYLSLGFSGFHAVTDAEIDDDFTNEELDYFAEGEKNAGRIFVKYEDQSVRHELSYQNYSNLREYASPTADYGYEGTRTKLEYKGSADVSENLSIDYGASHQVEKYDQFGDYGTAEAEFEMNSIFGGLGFANDRLNLDINGRIDDGSEFGLEKSLRIAGAYHPNEAVTLKTSYSTGYRAPSLYELYAPYGGNIELTPEKTKSIDASIEYKPSEITSLGLTIFQMKTENQIQYGTSYSYENIEGTTTRQGFELSGSTEIKDKLSLNIGYTNISTETEDGDRLAHIPAHEVNLGVTYHPIEGLDLSLVGKIVRDVEDRFGDELDDYNLLNARIDYKLGQGSVFLRAENLLGEDYQTVEGYGTSDRAFYVGYRVDF